MTRLNSVSSPATVFLLSVLLSLLSASDFFVGVLLHYVEPTQSAERRRCGAKQSGKPVSPLIISYHLDASLGEETI